MLPLDGGVELKIYAVLHFLQWPVSRAAIKNEIPPLSD
jgi:hypothetical protein